LRGREPQLADGRLGVRDAVERCRRSTPDALYGSGGGLYEWALSHDPILLHAAVVVAVAPGSLSIHRELGYELGLAPGKPGSDGST